jgi:phage anti-repressor protein
MTDDTHNQFPLVGEGRIGGRTVPTVNARDLHAFLDNGDHFATWIKDRIDQYGFAENVDFVSYSETSEKGGRPRQEFALSIDMAKELGMVDRSEKGKQVRLYFIEIERRAKSGLMLPDFSDPIVAARAWADEREARQIAERTKAEIGSRREATAMATASTAVKKANRLELELDRARSYATVKRMQMIYHGQSFNWRLLKQTAGEMGVPSIDIFDANYGTVKAYHADVWREAYALEIPEGEGDVSGVAA